VISTGSNGTSIARTDLRRGASLAHEHRHRAAVGDGSRNGKSRLPSPPGTRPCVSGHLALETHTILYRRLSDVYSADLARVRGHSVSDSDASVASLGSCSTTSTTPAGLNAAHPHPRPSSAGRHVAGCRHRVQSGQLLPRVSHAIVAYTSRPSVSMATRWSTVRRCVRASVAGCPARRWLRQSPGCHATSF
jgi:hypothetical protein